MGKSVKASKASSANCIADDDDPYPDQFPDNVSQLVEIMGGQESRVVADALGRGFLDASWPYVCSNVGRLRKVFENRGLVWSSSVLDGEIEKLRRSSQKRAGKLPVDQFTNAWMAMGSEGNHTVRAHQNQLFTTASDRLSQNDRDLIVRLDQRRAEASDIAIATEFYSGEVTAAKRALARIRRARSDGRTNLPRRSRSCARARI